ncbi:MAG: primosomal protein N', partial [Methylococcales bacterium]|nr:primosomal protein N' [Methylococcales bacterium]
QFLEEAKRQLQQMGGQCLGPIPSLMERKAGVFRAQLLIETKNKAVMQQLLNHWVPSIGQLPSAKRVRWQLDVDPLDVI